MTTATRAAAETGVLQLTRAEMDARAFRRWMGDRRLQDQDHAMHCLLTECFGRPPTKECPENKGIAPQPFRLIMPRDGGNGVLYGYGRAGADALREMAAICADPLQSRVIQVGTLDSKPMPESWAKDRRLGFEVRIRPVVRLQKNPDRVPANERLFKVDRPRDGEPKELPRPGKECDAFLWEALLHPKGEMKHSREQVYAEWLSGQLERRGGARLEEAKLVSFQRTRAHRKAGHGRPTEGPDAVMRGVIAVTDSEAFAALLAGGIGRHRAYGYGMLLLRPAGRPGPD